jgi:hypothetical protein
VGTEQDVDGVLAQSKRALVVATPLVLLPWLVEGIAKLPFAGLLMPAPGDNSPLGKIMGVCFAPGVFP